MSVESIRWHGDHLDLLDQRRLPEDIVYVTCRTAAETAAAIRDMVVRGAPAIGCAAAYGIALDARAGRNLAEAEALLAASRPTAVNLFWALERMRGSADPQAEALAIYAEDIAANKAMGAFGAALIADGARIMTHCNAGALATAGHGTALGVIRSARDAGKTISVIANETRPYLQGARLTAWELVQRGIPVTVLCDSAAGHLLATGRIGCCIVGADRITAGGDTANKIGTYGLAVLAAAHGVPFYVAAPSSTFDLSIVDGTEIPIEHRAAAEVTSPWGRAIAPPEAEAFNPAFDVTPARLIRGIITERGVIEPVTRDEVARVIGEA